MDTQMIPYYQSIPELGIKGRYNAPEEFDKIGLPKDLEGWDVLDIGCNIGAFLLECDWRGAYSITGVEVDDYFRAEAEDVMEKMGVPKENFMIFKDLDSLEREIGGLTYDLVLLLSVTHVVEGMSGQEILDKAWALTKRLLIVEINDRLQKEKIVLPEGAKFYGKNKDERSVYHIFKNNNVN